MTYRIGNERLSDSSIDMDKYREQIEQFILWKQRRGEWLGLFFEWECSF